MEIRYSFAQNLCAFQQLDYKLLQGHTTLIFGNNMDNDSQGSNGSGKSAMLEAIAIGITGETLRKIKMEEIINDAADTACIKLTMSNDSSNECMEITRELSRKSAQVIKISMGTKGEILTNIEQATVADYNKFILETLGLTKDDILPTSYCQSTNTYLSCPVLTVIKKKSSTASAMESWWMKVLQPYKTTCRLYKQSCKMRKPM